MTLPKGDGLCACNSPLKVRFASPRRTREAIKPASPPVDGEDKKRSLVGVGKPACACVLSYFAVLTVCMVSCIDLGHNVRIATIRSYSKSKQITKGGNDQRVARLRAALCVALYNRSKISERGRTKTVALLYVILCTARLKRMLLFPLLYMDTSYRLMK